MIDFTKLPKIFKTAQEKNYPKHVILNLFPLKTEDIKTDFAKLLEILSQLIEVQREKNLPILTINLGNQEDIHENTLYSYCKKLLKSAIEHKTRITVFGHWYDLQGQLVEELKKLNNETMDFDHFFLNICLNYDGKQEIADASRVIVRKVILEKQDMDGISPDIIKENIYSSYLLPPDLVIEPDNIFRGTFLWDSAGTQLISLNKEILHVSKSDFVKALETYSSTKFK